MFYTIYKIVGPGGKEYIGKHQTKNLNDDYMGSGKILRRAIQKHGAESFKKEILHVFDTEEEMNRKEAELVTEEYCLREDTYNICPGGKGGFGYIRGHDEYENWVKTGRKKANESLLEKYGVSNPMEIGSARQKISNTNKNRWRKIKEKSPDRFVGSDNPFFGKSHTDETKKRISETQKKKTQGENNPQYGKFWITDGKSSKMIQKDLPIPEGWYKGRTINRMV